MTFKLSIELGNDAMLDYSEIETALQDVARRMHHYAHDCVDPKTGHTGKISDRNGNNVGIWKVTR